MKRNVIALKDNRMSLKMVMFSFYTKIDPDEFPYIAQNMDGCVVGFKNPPVRDFRYNIWVDCTDGSGGTIIPYPNWEVSVRQTAKVRSVLETNAATANDKRVRARTERLKNKLGI